MRMEDTYRGNDEKTRRRRGRGSERRKGMNGRCTARELGSTSYQKDVYMCIHIQTVCKLRSYYENQIIIIIIITFY